MMLLMIIRHHKQQIRQTLETIGHCEQMKVECAVAISKSVRPR
jgi:hypothetical protein